MGKTSSAVKRKFNSKTYDTITISIRKDDILNKSAIKTYADTNNISVNQLILNAVRQYITANNNIIADTEIKEIACKSMFDEKFKEVKKK